MKKSRLMSSVSAGLLTLVASTSNAAIVDLVTVPMTAETDGYTLSFVADGVSVSARGYHVTHDSPYSSSTISGPYSTSVATPNTSPINYYFGRRESSSTGETVSGLQLKTTVGDYPSTTGDQSGFDNMGADGEGPSFQFALFSFDQAVNVSQVFLDAVTNYNTSIWVAGGNIAPNLNLDFASAFSGYSFINSRDDADNGPIHTFDPLEGVTYLAIGAAPKINVGNFIGDVEGINTNAHFYISGLNVTAVPVPAAVWLFGSGLLGLIGVARRKKAA